MIPARFFPYWKHRFERDRPRLLERFTKWQREEFAHMIDEVLGHIRDNGPTMARDLGNDTDRKKSNEGWWEWHPTKTALEYLWRTGELAIVRREGFQKVYDLSARAIPGAHFESAVSGEDFADWACQSAIERLGFATPGEISAFWELVSPEDARDWCDRGRTAGALIEVDVENADGTVRSALALPDIAERMAAAPEPPSRLRVQSPGRCIGHGAGMGRISGHVRGTRVHRPRCGPRDARGAADPQLGQARPRRAACGRE